MKFLFSKYSVEFLTKELSENFDKPSLQWDGPISQGHQMALRNMSGTFSWSQCCATSPPPTSASSFLPLRSFLLKLQENQLVLKSPFASPVLANCYWILQLSVLTWASHEGHSRTTEEHKHNWEQACWVWKEHNASKRRYRSHGWP